MMESNTALSLREKGVVCEVEHTRPYLRPYVCISACAFGTALILASFHSALQLLFTRPSVVSPLRAVRVSSTFSFHGFRFNGCDHGALLSLVLALGSVLLEYNLSVLPSSLAVLEEIPSVRKGESAFYTTSAQSIMESASTEKCREPSYYAARFAVSAAYPQLIGHPLRVLRKSKLHIYGGYSR